MIAASAKQNCPPSKALESVPEVTLTAAPALIGER